MSNFIFWILTVVAFSPVLHVVSRRLHKKPMIPNSLRHL
jgi:uncharacterized membrane protein YhaH (DUF805 family)